MGMKARPSAWSELATAVVVGRSEADAIALGGGDLDGVALADPSEVTYLGFQHAYDVWTSASGASYVCSWRDDPLFCRIDGSWQLVDVDAPGGERHSRIIRVVGFAGASPADDELYCVAEPYAIGPARQGTLLWRIGGVWRERELPPGRVWELAAGPRDVVISVGGERPVLVRARGGDLVELSPPDELVGASVVGVCAAPDDSLVVCYRAPGAETASAHLLRGDTWHSLAADAPLLGWATGYIDSVWWRGAVRLATDSGVFRVDGDRVVAELGFCATRLWPIGDALVCVGYRDGRRGHAIHRGDGWEPYSIPEPGTVRGARGKEAWLPRRRKVPRRRVRMTRAIASSAPRLPTGADDYCMSWLEPRAFAPRGAPRSSPGRLADDIGHHYGVEPSPQLRRYLELYDRYDLERGFGELQIWSPDDFAPPAREPSVHELASQVFYQAPSTIAALTNTVYLGADHGGQVYFAEVAPASSEVFLYAPGLGDLYFLADSLDSFFYLNDLSQQWADYARAHDVDFEDVENGDVDGSAPELRAIAAGLASLSSRVNLDDGADVASDFHELLPAIAGVRPVATSRSVTLRLFERAHWLIMALGEVYDDPAGAIGADFERDMADPELGGLAATRVYWLWHLYLFGDPRLTSFAASLAADPSSLVRSCAALMTALTRGDSADGFEAIVELRQRIRAALPS